jgi:hypothetical protein
MDYAPGTVVQVKEFGGRELARRVVRDIGKTVVVCNEQEFQAAQREQREADGIGFPKKDVIKVIQRA